MKTVSETKEFCKTLRKARQQQNNVVKSNNKLGTWQEIANILQVGILFALFWLSQHYFWRY